MMISLANHVAPQDGSSVQLAKACDTVLKSAKLKTGEHIIESAQS